MCMYISLYILCIHISVYLVQDAGSQLSDNLIRKVLGEELGVLWTDGVDGVEAASAVLAGNSFDTRLEIIEMLADSKQRWMGGSRSGKERGKKMELEISGWNWSLPSTPERQTVSTRTCKKKIDETWDDYSVVNRITTIPYITTQCNRIEYNSIYYITIE